MNNVFLDVNYQAVLGDYGFLFFLGKAKSAFAGKQGDVFGFKMLLLEAIVGKKKLDDRRRGRDDGSVGVCMEHA
jgi:hypothetical protein